MEEATASTEVSGSSEVSETVEDVSVLIEDCFCLLENLIKNEIYKEAKSILMSDDFVTLMDDISKLPDYQRSLLSCTITRRLLELLQFSGIRRTALESIKCLIENIMENDTLSPACAETIAVFLFKNSKSNSYISKLVVRELFVNNTKLWPEVEKLLIDALTKEEFYCNLAAINCSLIKFLYSVDCSIMVNVINFLSNTVNSEYFNIKSRSIKLALEIFTGEKSQFASGFYKLWSILCESMKDKSLHHELITGFVTKLLVKQPLFRLSYSRVLDFHVKFRGEALTEDIFTAIANAIVMDASIFLNDSYFVTFVMKGLLSKKPIIHFSALLSMAKIYQSNLFCKYTFTAIEEINWKKNNRALLNHILMALHINNSRVSHRALLKHIIYFYLVPSCLPQKRRVEHMLKMWMKVNVQSRSAITYVAKTSLKIRHSLLKTLGHKPKASVRKYVKIIALCLGEKVDSIMNLVHFLNRKKQSKLIMKVFLAESAEESTEIARHIMEIAQFEETNWPAKFHGIMESILNYITNNLFDKDSVIILLNIILKSAKQPRVRDFEIITALGLFEIVAIENPVISLEEAVFDKLVELLNLDCAESVVGTVNRIIEVISKFPDSVISVDKKKYPYYKHMKNQAKSFCVAVSQE